MSRKKQNRNRKYRNRGSHKKTTKSWIDITIGLIKSALKELIKDGIKEIIKLLLLFILYILLQTLI